MSQVVPGYAFAAPHVLVEHRALYEEAKEKVGDKPVVLERGYGYNTMKYLPDWAVIAGFTLHQQVMLVYGGPLPFGGRQEGSWLVVYTD